MLHCRPVLAVLLSALSSLAFAQNGVRTLTTEEARGFVLKSAPLVQIDNSGINLVRSFRLEFFNGTREEVQSVDVRFSIVEDGKTTFSKSTLRIDRFHDYPFARAGSALPNHRAPADYPITIEHPTELWNTDSKERFEVVAVRVYKDGGDLRDLGHMFTWLTKSPDLEIIQKLRQDPSLATTTFPGGANALALALSGSTVTAVQAMVDAGATIDPAVHIGDWDIPLLHLAAANEHPEPLTYLKSRGAKIDATNDAGHTALDVALDTGHIANAQWLLANGADPDRRDKDGNPPAYYAYRYKDLSGLEALAKAGANLKYHNKGFGLLHLVASTRSESTAALEKLVALGLPIDDADTSIGTTPLMLAASNQNNVGARWLLTHGAKLEARDSKGRDVFDYARSSNTLRTDELFKREVLAKLPKKRV